MFSGTHHRNQRHLTKHIVCSALTLLLLTNAHATLFGAEPEASTQKPEQSEAEAGAKHLREVLGRRVELNIGKAPLKDVLDEIATRYDIRIEQKYKDPKFGDTPVTFNASGRRLWDFFWKLQADSFLKPVEAGRIVCTLSGDRLVIEQLSQADAAAWAWLNRRITCNWKKTLLEAVLREISEREQIDIRLEDTVPEIERMVQITFSAPTKTPLHQIFHQILEPLGLETRVREGRMTVRQWPIESEAQDPRVARILQEPSHFEFVDVPLKKVLKTLASQHYVKIVLDLPKDADVRPDTPITLFSDDVEGYLTDTTLRGAFYRLLVPLQLAVQLRDGAFCIVEDVGQ